MMGPDQGKLFVGGITRETNEDTLKGHFSKYGSVLSTVVARDKNTKLPRGFGFVLFSEPASADDALHQTHVILGRTVDVKKAIPRSEQQHQHSNSSQVESGGWNQDCCHDDSNNQLRTRKIFVGGLSASLTEGEFRNYFSRFGSIMDVVVMHDSMTNRPRGFGFVTFDSEESVENVMQKNFHQLNYMVVEVKRAVPKDGNNKNGAWRKSPYNRFQTFEYPPSYPGYEFPPGYATFPGYDGIGSYPYAEGFYGGGYPAVGYGRIGYVPYGITPIGFGPRSPLYPPVMPGGRVFTTLYNAAYTNGVVGMIGSVTRGNYITRPGLDGKVNQTRGGNEDKAANITSPQNEGVDSGLKKSDQRALE